MLCIECYALLSYQLKLVSFKLKVVQNMSQDSLWCQLEHNFIMVLALVMQSGRVLWMCVCVLHTSGWQ